MFSDIWGMSNADMSEVNWAIYKDYMDFDDEDFFHPSQFYVHVATGEDTIQLVSYALFILLSVVLSGDFMKCVSSVLSFNLFLIQNAKNNFHFAYIQELPGEFAQGYNIPSQGNVILCNPLMNVQTDGTYTYRKGKEITLWNGWMEFCDEVNIVVASLLIIKVEMRENCIRVVVDVVN